MADTRDYRDLATLSGTPHAFLTGLGENGPPDPARLVEGGRLVLLDQVHSADVVQVTEPFGQDQRPKADAMVTRTCGLVLGIVTADCAPVLLADRTAGVVGAAHAGWRGARAGIVENTVAAMCALGAKRDRIAAAIGPCIHQRSYEVDARFRAEFRKDGARFFAPGREGHWQFDLPGYVDAQLARAGVVMRSILALDTYALPDCLHSYRRATHEGRDTTGRQYSLIALR